MHHTLDLPLRVGIRGSPLALTQTRLFLSLLTRFCPALVPGIGQDQVFQQHVICTTGDKVQDRSLSEIGGKGLVSKEIYEALLDRRIDFAVHSLKDLETELPPGIVLACTLRREDARDVLVLGPRCRDAVDSPLDALPPHAVIGTNSLRRQAQLLHARPDLSMALLRGNVQPRLAKVARGDCDASLLALAGLRLLGLEGEARIVPLDSAIMVPSTGQGIVGITIRADDTSLYDFLSGIEDPEARAISTVERALLASLEGSCKTPIGEYARLLDDGALHLTGLVARPDGSFLLKRTLTGAAADAARLGTMLDASLRADAPRDIFA